MDNFTPVSASIGGLLIGLSAVMLMALNGRIAGISGIASGVLFSKGDRLWRLWFVIGLILAPVLVRLFGHTVPFNIDVGPGLLVLGGLLTGFGTSLGSGCTSGHGVCGLSRLSPRSLVAVLIFMAFGVAAASSLRLLIGEL